MSNTTLLELADEFDADAEMLERVADVFLKRGMDKQHEILWHEAVVYRCCSDRLKQTAAVAVEARGKAEG